LRSQKKETKEKATLSRLFPALLIKKWRLAQRALVSHKHHGSLRSLNGARRLSLFDFATRRGCKELASHKVFRIKQI